MSDPVVLLSTGDVVGPAGGVTDNSMVLFSGTSGKLIKGNNAVVTTAGLALLDDVNAAAQRVTLGLGNVDNTSDINKPISTATQTALNLKATIASPTFTDTPTAPTAAAGTSTTQIATTAFVTAADNLKANINSPTFTGVPSAPTPSIGTRSTAIATMQNFDNEFGATLSSSGYQKLPSGLIIQWGGATVTIALNGAVEIAFPTTFPNDVFAIAPSLATASDIDGMTCNYRNLSTSGVRLNVGYSDGSAKGYRYIVIGR